MHIVIDPDALVQERLITAQTAQVMKDKSRQVMMALAINTLLCAAILSATLGLIFWLADALSVALVGVLLLAGGLAVLAWVSDVYRIFGNAAALIGSGMLIIGAGLELSDKYPDIAAWVMIPGGVLIAALAGRSYVWGGLTTKFVAGTICVMGVALHLWGALFLVAEHDIGGPARAIFHLYVAAAIFAAGWLVDVRLITALAIIPFAQVFDTGTDYLGAIYVFYSPEPTLTILQMSLAITLSLWLAGRMTERSARHLGMFAIMGFIVANLSALVGSLWGDWVGRSLWGPVYSRFDGGFEAYKVALEAYKDTALYISEDVYSIAWALVLIGLIFLAARQNRRGLFNAAMTFAGIHAYTQAFESFYNYPLAYVIGGLTAIPVAWWLWQMNQKMIARQGAARPDPEDAVT